MFVMFVVERPNPWPGVLGFHELWHLVVVAALFHYLLMYFYVLPA
jgi:hemolysin III